MQNTVCENQNQLRKQIRSAWSQPFSQANAVIIKTGDRFNVASALRLFANELGARFIILDIYRDLSEEQSELLGRRGPRLVLISGLDTMTEAAAAQLPTAINAGGKALPIFVQECANDAEPDQNVDVDRAA